MKRPLTLAALALLLVLTRLFVATSAPDVFERGEEYVRGAAAVSVSGGLLEGINSELDAKGEPRVSPAVLFYHPYEGGGFVHALLTAGAFELFGPTLLAHKLVAIAFELLLLFAGLWLVREAFGPRAEVPFALLWTFSPLAFQKLALLNLGIHYQALVFQFALAALALGALRGAPHPRWMGLVAGFGLFYNYQLAPLIGLVGLALLVHRTLNVRDWLQMIAAFLLGALPLILMLIATGSEMLNIHGQELGTSVANPPGLAELFTSLREALGPRGAVQLLALAGLAVFAGWRSSGPARLLLGYLVAFTLLIPFSGFLTTRFHDYFGAMRYAPLFGFATVLTAGALATPRRSLAGLFVVLVLLGMSSTHSAARTGESPLKGLERIRHTQGLDFTDYDAKITSRWPLALCEDRRGMLGALLSVRGAPRDSQVAAATEALTRHEKVSLTAILGDLQATASEDWQAGLLGLGAWAMRGAKGDMALGAKRLMRRLKEQPDELLAPATRAQVSALLLEGLGRYGSGAWPTEEVLAGELDQVLDNKLGPAVLKGLGMRLHRSFGLRPRALDDFLQGRPENIKVLVHEALADAERSLRGD